MKLSLLNVSQVLQRPSKTRFPLAVIGTVALLLLLFQVGKQFNWTGFGEDKTVSTTVERNAQRQVVRVITTTTPQSGKTLWDVLSLVGVPASLALLAWWLQVLQQQRSEQQAQQEKEIAESNQKEEALQAYFDRISDLLIEKNLIAIATKVKAAEDKLKDEEVDLFNAAKDVIQARTLSILRRLGNDNERKSAVIRFLAESDVIEQVGLALRSVDSSGINLAGANLKGICLVKANLRNANLNSAKLCGVNFSQANLAGASLKGTKLEGADLSSAQGLTIEQLNKAFLCNTRLPQELQSLSNRDCEEWESRFKELCQLQEL